MKLKAHCSMTVTAYADSPVVAVLRPRSGRAQWMMSERYEIVPLVPTSEMVDPYGNLCQRFTVPQGTMRIEVEMVLQAEDHIAVQHDAHYTPVARLPDDVLHYLLPSRYCPSDKMQGQALSLVQGHAPGYAQVEAIRAWIHANIEYRYGVSTPNTDALDTLVHGAGVCRDFSHVGIALCRALKIPARVVVGYLWQLDPMDMHAWFEAFVGGRWYTFDATQSEPRGGRIVVAYGRDAADVAFISDYGAVPLQMGEMHTTVTRLDMPELAPHEAQPTPVDAPSPF